MTKSNLPKDLITELIQVISSITDLHSIYYIGGRKASTSYEYIFNSKKKRMVQIERYSLAIIINVNENPPIENELKDLVYSKMKEQVEIYPLIYTIGDAEKRMDNGDNFLCRVLTSKYLLSGTQTEVNFRYTQHPKMFEIIENEWRFRIKNAHYFSDILGYTDAFISPNGEVSILSQSVKQACIALLFVFWEWRPTNYDMTHLLNLSSFFCQSPRILLPDGSYDSQKVYHALCNAESYLNCQSDNHISHDFTYEIANKCDLFLEAVKKEGQEKLNELDILHHKTNKFFIS